MVEKRDIADAAFAAIVRGSLDAVIVGDEDGRVIEFNPAAERLFGWSRKEALTRSIAELIVPPHLRKRHEAGMARMRDGEPPRLTERRVEVEAMRHGGEVFRCELSVARLHMDGPPLFAASIRDLTPLEKEQDARREVEELLRAIFDDQTEVIFRYDANMRIVFYNEAARRLYGVSRTGLLGRHFLEDVDPTARERLASDLAALTPSSAVCLATDPKRLPNGNVRWIEWTNRALFDDQDQLTGYQAVGRDVTERHLAEEALERERAENRLYRRTVEAMPDLVYSKDREGRFLTANAATAQALGVAASGDLLGRKAEEFVARSTAQEIAKEEQEFLDAGLETQVSTEQSKAIPGAERWLSKQRTLFRDDSGAIAGVIAHIRDVTEQVESAIALDASEKRFAAFMQYAPVGMYIKDSEGRYVDANPEMEKVFQQAPESLIGKSAADLMPPDLAEMMQAADDRVRETGLTSSIEEHIPNVGAYEWTLVVRFPIEQSPGGPIHIGGFDIDITSQKRAEIEVAQAREALHQSEKLKALGSFAAGVAHELNNPLAILAGQAELLAEDTAGGPFEARGEKIRRAANRCARTVRSFLAMARHDPPERRPLDVNAVIDSALDLASWTLNASSVGVVRDYATSLPIIVGDQDQLHQVVLNLLLNAQQAMEDWPEERTISVATTFDPDANTVRIVLKDTGPGVTEEKRQQVFLPFFTTRPAGIGIGLPFCRRVIEAHGGSITLDDTARGASFTIDLPIDATLTVTAESQS